MKIHYDWPGTMPSELEGTLEALVERLNGAEIVPFEADRRPARQDVVILFPDAVAPVDGDAARHDLRMERMLTVVGWEPSHTIFVVGDGYLGSDGSDVAGTMLGGAAVAAARSLAIREGAKGRANVVCLPEQLFGRTTSQCGPLPLTVGKGDVVDALAYFLSEGGSYLNGQVLFVNAGRQLFSSMTA
jgi:hypothetical protein